MSQRHEEIPEAVVEGIFEVLNNSSVFDALLFCSRYVNGCTLDTLGSASLISMSAVNRRLDRLCDQVKIEYEEAVCVPSGYYVTVEGEVDESWTC
jgi:hypothetical protein